MDPNDFFTLESLGTFGGTTLATTVFGNTFSSLTNKNPKIFSFIISIIICGIVAWPKLESLIDYVVVLLNGCLVYCTALGLNNQVSSVAEKTTVRSPGAFKNRIAAFFKPW